MLFFIIYQTETNYKFNIVLIYIQSFYELKLFFYLISYSNLKSAFVLVNLNAFSCSFNISFYS